MRKCDECTACCQGWLEGEAYGCKFGQGKACPFLTVLNCSIHSCRPEVCKNFYCGWLQELFPEWMRPDKSKVLISVENWSKGQFLRCVEMGQPISVEALAEIKKFSEDNNCPYIIQHEKERTIIGPEEFLKEKS
jgi:hypothetical protein